MALRNAAAASAYFPAFAAASPSDRNAFAARVPLLSRASSDATARNPKRNAPDTRVQLMRALRSIGRGYSANSFDVSSPRSVGRSHPLLTERRPRMLHLGNREEHGSMKAAAT